MVENGGTSCTVLLCVCTYSHPRTCICTCMYVCMYTSLSLDHSCSLPLSFLYPYVNPNLSYIEGGKSDIVYTAVFFFLFCTIIYREMDENGSAVDVGDEEDD